jgi:hypothetical protein
MRTIRNLLPPTCTTQTIAIHTSKGPVRSERVIATYLYIPALLEMSEFDKETTIFLSIDHLSATGLTENTKNSTECVYTIALCGSVVVVVATAGLLENFARLLLRPRLSLWLLIAKTDERRLLKPNKQEMKQKTFLHLLKL